MADGKVHVRIKPLKGIGGVGEAGDLVWMTPEDAEMYFRDGYVEYVTPPPTPPQIARSFADAQDRDLERGEVKDHDVMKPQNKRSRKK